MSTDAFPTAEAIARAVARVTNAANHVDALGEQECVVIDVADARLLLTLAADYVPVDERERAADLLWRSTIHFLNGNPNPSGEARRLLKLPAREGA